MSLQIIILCCLIAVALLTLIPAFKAFQSPEQKRHMSSASTPLEWSRARYANLSHLSEEEWLHHELNDVCDGHLSNLFEEMVNREVKKENELREAKVKAEIEAEIFQAIENRVHSSAPEHYPLAVTISSEMSPEDYLDVVLSIVVQGSFIAITLMKEDYSFYQVNIDIEELIEVKVDEYARSLMMFG